MGDVISSFLFQPPSPPTPLRLRSSSYCSHMELEWLTTSRGSRIPALFIHRKYARYTFLYSHGNAEDLGMLIDYLLDMSKILHVNILAYDYTGYGYSNRASTADDSGVSPILPSEEHCYADITAAYQYLVKIRGIEPRTIILYGRSVGSGPSCYLAQKLNSDTEKYTRTGCSAFSSSSLEEESLSGSFSDGTDITPRAAAISMSESVESELGSPSQDSYFGGIILHSPFTSIYRIVINLGFSLHGDVFRNINRAPDIKCPALIIHGTKDEIVPFSHGKALHAALPAAYKIFDPFWAEGMGHNNIEVDATNMFVRNLMEFVQLLLKRQDEPYATNVGRHGMPISDDTSLTKEYVQSHVMCMMDKQKKQITDGFLQRHKKNSRYSKFCGMTHEVSVVPQYETKRSTDVDIVTEYLSPQKIREANLSTQIRTVRAVPFPPEARSPISERGFQ